MMRFLRFGERLIFAQLFYLKGLASDFRDEKEGEAPHFDDLE
jgi:hypothetical protein